MVTHTGNHGHRQRLRARLNKNPQDLADYELLELLLTYALPRKETLNLWLKLS